MNEIVFPQALPRSRYLDPQEPLLLRQYMMVPVQLVEDSCYAGLSGDAKLLYAMLLRRSELSRKNGWQKDGRVFVYYTLEEIMEVLHCAHGKAAKLLNELEWYNLLRVQRQGQGRPNILFPLISSVLEQTEDGTGTCSLDRYWLSPTQHNRKRKNKVRDRRPDPQRAKLSTGHPQDSADSRIPEPYYPPRKKRSTPAVEEAPAYPPNSHTILSTPIVESL